MKDNLVYIIIFIGSLCFSLIMFGFLLPYLRRIKFGQSIRKEGPSKHMQKAGTPTMGGLGIILSTTIIFGFLLGLNHFKGKDFTIEAFKEIILILLPFWGYGIIGFIDDYLIVKKRNNQGLKSNWKFSMQMLLAIGYYFIYLDLGFSNTLNFFGTDVNLAWLYGVLIIILFTSTTNATNITDGVDGLLAGCGIISFIAFLILAILVKNSLIIYFSIAMIISLFGYLFYNLPKAKLFMGDVGSLAIGASLVSVAIFLKMELLLLVIGFVYVVETLSVILQVWFFKKTKGKRLFRMSPFHHHLELSGLSEWEIDIIMWLIAIVFGGLGITLGRIMFI